MRTPFLAALALTVLVGCSDGLSPDGSLDFGDVYLPTDHEARYTFSNAATGTQTLGVPTFTTGFAFGMVSTLPQEVDGGVPWAIDFRFTPPAGEFGAQTDTATFPVTSGANTYSVTVQLRATFIEGDADGDGHVSTEFEGDDCDDANPNTYAGAQEICDGFDNDCDGNLGASELDDDNDGYLGCGDDCDDDDVTRHPGAEEGCDGLDTDCDGALGADELDGDGDGWTGCDGDCEPEVAAVNPDENEDTCDGYDTDCDQGGVVPPLETDNDNDGFRACNGDCDDEEPRARPGATEVCDGVDNDCDTILPADEFDLDGDGWFLCNGECNDQEPASFPGNPEICDGIDNNCDTVVPPDEGDTDGDGQADCADCAPNDPLAFTGAPEVCDGVDNDCSGVADEGFDVDQDNYSSCAGDCNDADPAINPLATEVCDGVDNDCLNGPLLGELDDGDGDGVLDCADGDCPHHVDATSASGAPDGTLAEAWSEVQEGIDGAVAASCLSVWVHPGELRGADRLWSGGAGARGDRRASRDDTGRRPGRPGRDDRRGAVDVGAARRVHCGERARGRGLIGVLLRGGAVHLRIIAGDPGELLHGELGERHGPRDELPRRARRGGGVSRRGRGLRGQRVRGQRRIPVRRGALCGEPRRGGEREYVHGERSVLRGRDGVLGGQHERCVPEPRGGEPIRGLGRRGWSSTSRAAWSSRTTCSTATPGERAGASTSSTRRRSW